MDVLPWDAPHDAIVDAVERNWRASVGTFGLAPTTTVRDDAEMFWYVTGLPDATFNSVMYANLAPELVGAAVEELRALRQTHGVPMGWLVGPTSRPRDLGERLVAHGLRHVNTLTPMTISLPTLQAEAQPVPGLTIERVADPRTLDEWIEVERRGFGMDGPLADRFGEVRRQMGVGHGLPLTHLLGRLEGEPVATATLMLDSGIGGIHDVSTIPEARRRGIGRAMTVAALEAARAEGYEIAFLQPSAMGRPIYERIGFRECCACRIYI